MPNSVATLTSSPTSEPLHMMPGNALPETSSTSTTPAANANTNTNTNSANTSQETLEGFEGIAASFQDAQKTTISAGYNFASGEILIDAVMAAIMKFLIVFDALGSPILAAIVGKDFEAKEVIINNARLRENAPTVKELVEIEEDKKNKKKNGKARSWGFISIPQKEEQRGSEALWWCMRVMKFVDNLVLNLINDEELRNAAIISYRNTLANNHNAVTRGIFENALNFLPETKTFLCNLYNIKDNKPTQQHFEQLKVSMREFRKATKPHIQAFSMVFPE